MMTLNEIRKLRGMTLSEFSRKSGLSPHTARNDGGCGAGAE